MQCWKNSTEDEGQMEIIEIDCPVTKEELEFLSLDDLMIYRSNLAILLYEGVPRGMAERSAYILTLLGVSSFEAG
jgi:hypothetical protein